MDHASADSKKSPRPLSHVLESQSVVCGIPISSRLVEKIGPFLAGMLTTYMLQIIMPTVWQYTSAAARFLRMAFFWLAVAAAAGWYMGIISPQASDLQFSINQIFAKFQTKPVPRTLEEKPDLSFPRKASNASIPRSPRSTSPSRAAKKRDHVQFSPVQHKSALEPSLSAKAERSASAPTINLRPFVTPIRDTARNTRSDILIPQSFDTPVLNTIKPESEGKDSASSHLRKAAHLKGSPKELRIPEFPNNDFKNINNITSSQANLDSRAMSNRKVADSRQTSRRSAQANTKDEKNGKLESRRSSNDPSSIGQNPANLNKPLPLVEDTEADRLSDKEFESSLSRADSVMSKKSVLGTRANYTKFLANVHG